MVTYAVGSIILGIAAILLTQILAKGKSGKGTRMIGLWVGGILTVLAVVSFVSPGTIPFLEGEIPMGGGALSVSTQPGSPLVGGQCVGIEDTTVTLSAVDKYTQASTGGTHRYRINGAPALTVSDAGTLTASPGDVIEILWENATQSVSYFSDISKEVVPCAGTVTYSKELFQNGTVTIDIFNEEGDLIDNGVNNETLAAGDVVTLLSRVKGTYQRGIPYGGVMVTEWNTTSIDDVIVEFGGAEVEVPGVFTITLGTEAKTKAFSIPGVETNNMVEGKITIDVDDSFDPTVGGDDSVKITFYPYNYYINEDKGGIFNELGVEDEDDIQTYQHTTTTLLTVD